MKKLFIFYIVLFSFEVNAQIDTLYEEDLRKVGDLLFQNLDKTLYGPSLIDRSFSTKETTKSQYRGDYSQIHTIVNFFELHEDLYLAYTDSTYLKSPLQMSNYIYDRFEEYERDTTYLDEELIQPFGLLYHYVSNIDSNYLDTNYFTVNDFHITPLISEDSLYQMRIYKSAALFEFYPDNEYDTGLLKYESGFISFSPNISETSIKINVGDGFVPFDNMHPFIRYNRSNDSMVAFAALKFKMDGIFHHDTLKFYITTQGKVKAKESSDGWDDDYYFTATNGRKIRVMFKKGCGNPTDVKYRRPRRPIIIAPPYRPVIQNFSLKKYWEQFNYKSVMSSLSEMGYDIYFLKLKPGNGSLDASGDALMDFIKDINYKKDTYFPTEHYENIIMGYSMGGQVARYALLKMEKQHMENGGSHHHSRLYLPFDSPHHGANIPLFCQATFYDLRNMNVFAGMAWQSLIDGGSKGMSIYHWLGSPKEDLGNNKYRLFPMPTSEQTLFQSRVYNDFNHVFSHTAPGDTRKSFPSFTRNIAVSTGNVDKNYNSEYGLTPGKLLFEQNTVASGLGFLPGFATYKERRLYASMQSPYADIYKNKERIFVFYPIVYHHREYSVKNAYEWDMASGGYKDEFYDSWIQVAGINLIPISPVSILRYTGSLFGHKYYDKHMNFLPTTSALAINPTIWQNNNLFYNLKGNGLMFNSWSDLQNNIKSETYGYPNLGRPTDHFSITPFEAVYCDKQTYEHIKMQASIDDNPSYSDLYLVYLRDFILDEVEADIVCLQNKTIGKNHKVDPTYKYRATYKAYDQILIGNLVSPKTDPGDYIIEKTGVVDVHAKNSITLSPSFHTQSGSDFHAYIYYDGCSRLRE
jgi:hypothetical protein